MSLPEPAADSPTSPATRIDMLGRAVVSVTWCRSETYDHDIPLTELAEAIRYTSEEIAADPETLIGVSGPRLAQLLTSRLTPDDSVGVIEVEVVSVDYGYSPALAELAVNARAVVDAETNAGRHTPAGLALAALLAGLRREGVTDT